MSNGWKAVEVGRQHNPFYTLVPQVINSDLDDMLREIVLADLDTFTGWAVKGNRVALQCKDGRAVLFADKDAGLVAIDYVSDRKGTEKRRYQFWMNASSLSALSAALKSAGKDREIAFDTIFETRIVYKNLPA